MSRFRALFLLPLYATLLFSLFLIGTQDTQIFPAILFSLHLPNSREPESLPEDVTSTFVDTTDGERLEVWSVASRDKPTSKAAIVFHGNGETVESSEWILKWLSEQGFNAYNFDYRGYGRSTGWPSEEGLYRDADAVWDFVESTGGVPQRTAVIGLSIGTGPASYLSRRINAGAVVLVAPYQSLPALVSQKIPYNLLAPFLWYELPVEENLRAMESLCGIAVHGGIDTMIPYSHSLALESTLKHRKDFKVEIFEDAGHNDILGKALPSIERAVDSCILQSN